MKNAMDLYPVSEDDEENGAKRAWDLVQKKVYVFWRPYLR